MAHTRTLLRVGLVTMSQVLPVTVSSLVTITSPLDHHVTTIRIIVGPLQSSINLKFSSRNIECLQCLFLSLNFLSYGVCDMCKIYILVPVINMKIFLWTMIFHFELK